MRRHIRPVGQKCEYYKFALICCERLGAPPSDFMLHMPDLGELPVDPTTVRVPITTAVTSAVNTTMDSVTSPRPGRTEIDSDLLKELIHENVASRKMLEESQIQMHRIVTQLADLSIHRSNQYGAGVPATPVTTATTSVLTSVTSGPTVMSTAVNSVFTSTSQASIPSTGVTSPPGFGPPVMSHPTAWPTTWLQGGGHSASSGVVPPSSYPGIFAASPPGPDQSVPRVGPIVACQHLHGNQKGASKRTQFPKLTLLWVMDHWKR